MAVKPFHSQIKEFFCRNFLNCCKNFDPCIKCLYFGAWILLLKFSCWLIFSACLKAKCVTGQCVAFRQMTVLWNLWKFEAFNWQKWLVFDLYQHLFSCLRWKAAATKLVDMKRSSLIAHLQTVFSSHAKSFAFK